MENIHEMLRGEHNSTVELTFVRNTPDAQEFTLTVLRHASHEYDNDLNSPVSFPTKSDGSSAMSSPTKSVKSSVSDHLKWSPMPSPKKDVPSLRLSSLNKGEGSESAEATEEFDGIIGTTRSTTINELQEDDTVVTF